jgi:hypothetical protein
MCISSQKDSRKKFVHDRIQGWLPVILHKAKPKVFAKLALCFWQRHFVVGKGGMVGAKKKLV